MFRGFIRNRSVNSVLNKISKAFNTFIVLYIRLRIQSSSSFFSDLLQPKPFFLPCILFLLLFSFIFNFLFVFLLFLELLFMLILFLLLLCSLFFSYFFPSVLLGVPNLAISPSPFYFRLSLLFCLLRLRSWSSTARAAEATMTGSLSSRSGGSTSSATG